MGSTDRIREVARRVAKWARAGHRMIVVPSAMSGETNRLLALAKELAPASSTPQTERERDMIAATGEQVSVGLLALALQAQGVDAVSYAGWQVAQGVETFHQATLEAGGFVRVDDALACRFVQLADGLQNGLFGFGSVLYKRGASLIDGCASRTADVAIAQTALLVLAVPFDLRLNVSQGLPLSFLYVLICAAKSGTGAVFYMMLEEMSRKFTVWR